MRERTARHLPSGGGPGNPPRGADQPKQHHAARSITPDHDLRPFCKAGVFGSNPTGGSVQGPGRQARDLGLFLFLFRDLDWWLLPGLAGGPGGCRWTTGGQACTPAARAVDTAGARTTRGHAEAVSDPYKSLQVADGEDHPCP